MPEPYGEMFIKLVTCQTELLPVEHDVLGGYLQVELDRAELLHELDVLYRHALGSWEPWPGGSWSNPTSGSFLLSYLTVTSPFPSFYGSSDF